MVNYSVVVNSVQKQVYRQLYDAIVSLELKPGAVISTNDVAEKLCVSRTPVREAFLTLKEEGLLDISPQRPSSVSKIDLNRVYQERFVREALELKNITLFVEKATDQDIEILEKEIADYKCKMGDGDYFGILMLDQEFHKYMLHVTGNLLAESIINRMNGHYNRIRMLSLMVDDIRSDVYREHESILSAIKTRNAEDAYDLLKQHINILNDQEKVLINRFPDYFRELISKRNQHA